MEWRAYHLTHSACWQAGRTIVPKGVMVHSPGVAQPDPEVFIRQWNTPCAEACVHALVTEWGAIQLLPWNRRAWHAGTAAPGKISANNTHISFEILEPAGHSYRGGTMVGYDPARNGAYFRAVYENAVELTAALCRRYGLDPMARGVVICHAEGHALGVASNHADVLHWFPKHEKSMDEFRADVARMLKGEATMTQEEFNKLYRAAKTAGEAGTVSPWAAESWKKAARAGIFDGTRPGGPMTREQAALILDRLGLLK